MKQIIVFKCNNCGSIMLANNWERHKMVFCDCKKVAFDMDSDFTRILGNEDNYESVTYSLDELLVGKNIFKKIWRKFYGRN